MGEPNDLAMYKLIGLVLISCLVDSSSHKEFPSFVGVRCWDGGMLKDNQLVTRCQYCQWLVVNIVLAANIPQYMEYVALKSIV